MLLRTASWFAAAAAIVLCAAGVYLWFTPNVSGMTLGEVIATSERADTLHVRFGDRTEQIEIWHANNPPRARWDDLAGGVRVFDRGRFWVVREPANQVRRSQPPAGVEQPLTYLLTRWGVNSDALLEARPSERRHEAGHDLLIYRAEVPTRGGPVTVEAIAFADTGRLRYVHLPNHELTVLAYDQPIGEEKFAIADTLTEDGRIGKVADVQGIVTLRPALAQRWTPVRTNLVLRPGDWVRTDARGANATALRLVKETRVILGPKSLVELVGPKQVRLIEGEIEVTPAAGRALELLGPKGEKLAVKAKQLVRARGEKLTTLDAEPAWLLGFKGATTNNVLGSLVALVDGRNEPLSVGYHKVTVDIRDQIARTVIEESFVNHTDTLLEGVFQFPLPADASISGFGMWIGDQYVEADVVEKQRAREIYEAILRERRDPGLLEWSGGNLFKARVWPIQPNSEKRIKITYTQVLPVKGNRYRYNYALVREMLKQHPLRELNLNVKVHSAVPLARVTSPTHTVRSDRTERSAHVEFSAQEYTPTRDFEVVVELEKRQADAVLIPHRRGDDGYFMLQFAPPLAALPADRALLADGDPMNLLILADTSASIDAGQRATQAAFIGTLLSALGPKDTFNLAVCDVTCDWAFGQPAPGEPGNLATARDFLARRTPLGWTDLDRAFAAALRRAGPNTHIVYVGDGIVTTGDADPVAFANRLRRLYDGSTATLHAVALGSSYEAGVLKTIASLGSGSLRKITSEQGPQVVAQELLGEMAQPGLRDLKVEFKGMKVARVFPESLANVPAGTQQILLGRYLPEGKDQQGEVIVTGTQGGKPVRFSARVSLKDAEDGNSFIPRLWARMQLDSLLDQGATATIRDEIIALSEEYQIITPYTSLLVLESDADRERFKVTRRFRMRDGERFFTEGRDNAVFDLTQKQMKRAGAWRTALRRAVLRELARLGRDPRVFRPAPYRDHAFKDMLLSTSEYDYARATGRPGMSGGGPGGMAFGGGEWLLDQAERLPQSETYSLGVVPPGDPGQPAPLDGVEFEAAREGNAGDTELAERLDTVTDARELNNLLPSNEQQAREMAGPAAGPAAAEPSAFFDHREFAHETPPVLAQDLALRRPANEYGYSGGRMESFGRAARSRHGPSYHVWFDVLFPALPEPAASKPAKSAWPAAARQLAQSLLRHEQLQQLTGGLEITRTTDTFDPRWNEQTGRSRRIELATANAWLTRSAHAGGATLVAWCDGKEVGAFSTAFLLGQVRAAKPGDRLPPLELADYSLTSLEQSFSTNTQAAVEPQGKDRVRLLVKDVTDADSDVRMLLDTARHVLLALEFREHGRLSRTTTYGDFVEVAGRWWAQRIETTDAHGKRVSLITQTVKALPADAVAGRMQAELATRSRVQFIHRPLPGVLAARKAVAAGKAGFDDQFTLLLHFHHRQQWPRVLERLDAAEKPAAGKPGLRWLRSALLLDSRRHDELRKRFEADATRLGSETSDDAFSLAEYVVGQANRVLAANEMLGLLEKVRPIYEKQAAYVGAARRWQDLRITYLTQAGRTDDALKLEKQLATDFPHDCSLQHHYVQLLGNHGDYAAAYAWLKRILGKKAPWSADERDALRSDYTRYLEQEGRFADQVKYLTAWVQENPAGRTAYDQHLGALLKADRFDEATTLALRWLKEGQTAQVLAPPVGGRLDAAVSYLLGNGHGISTNRIEERWLPALAEAALAFARRPERMAYANQIIGHQEFQRSEEWRTLRKVLAGSLTSESDRLAPAQLEHFVSWVQTDDLTPAAWTKLAAGVRQRWTSEKDDAKKHVLGQAVVTVLSRAGTQDAVLAFLRVERETGPAAYRAAYTQRLFQALLAQNWTAEVEAEALTLLTQLSESDAVGERLFAAVAALHQLTDRMIEARYRARMSPVEHAEKLTRTELLKKQTEARRLAREGLADRLRKEAARQPGPLGYWLIAESVYLDLLLDRNLAQAAAAAWEQLGPAPAATADAEPSVQRGLADTLRQRYLTTLLNLAARKSADPQLRDRLAKYIDQGIAGPESARWKLVKYRLLVVLDRPKELEKALTAWAHEDEADSRWRVALGYLLAEQGRVADAIREFEAVKAADELTSAGYRALADWYLVTGRKTDHEQAARAVYQALPEHVLQNMVLMRLQPWQRGDRHLPTELDPEVLRMFAVLFDRSAAPRNYLYSLQQFYGACHDFRLLSVMADAVVGHTAEGVYPFVGGMAQVLNEVRDEATADEIVKQVGAVRQRAKTTVDQRALDLLEVQVERRAAELQNQPGPHRDRALAALVRAGKRAWTPGEPRQMADFLADLGGITEAPLAREQLRLFAELHENAIPGTQDRLHIAYRYAMTLDNYRRHADAIDRLQTALGEFQQANDGVLPSSANAAFVSLLGLLQDRGQFARAEKRVHDELQRPANAEQRRWLTLRLNEVYHRALGSRAEVSLGKGPALYQALEGKLRKDVFDTDPNQRYQLINLLCGVYRTAHEHKFDGVAADLKRFAYDLLPALLPQLVNYHPSTVSSVAQTVHDVLGPGEGIVFLVTRIETEPRWLRYRNQDGWNQHAWTLAAWRLTAKNLGAAEEGRLLRLVLAELRRDLERRDDRGRPFYSKQSGERFWAEKADDFARVAEEVLAERNPSNLAVQHLAHYFYFGLGRANRAIEILAVAHKQQILDETGQHQLIDYLHREQRYADSIPLLLPLVERRPENFEYFGRLMYSYFRTGQSAKLLPLLRRTDALFHKLNRWDEHTLSQLAGSALQCELFKEAVAYYKELIPLHERTRPGRGVGDGTLSSYYVQLANAYAGLNQTVEAVDAAGAAIVAWGPHHQQRAQALETLKQVLAKAPDLDRFSTHLDRQKQDSALIRKMLGQAYRAHGQLAKATRQFELAAELQPGDAETNQLLLAAYDQAGNKEAALTQLEHAVQHARRDLKLYAELGKRYAAAGRALDAERAFTSIIEVQPSEAESHSLYAELREQQGRWTEAITHWEQVARLRALEPTGLLKLAAAQLHERQWAAARATLERLRSHTWAQRFGDVAQQVRVLEAKIKQ